MNREINPEAMSKVAIETAASMDEWRQLVSQPIDFETRTIKIPLPPGHSAGLPNMLQSLFDDLRRADAVHSYPVGEIVCIGELGAISAYLLHFLSGGPIPHAIDVLDWQERVINLSNERAGSLICCDPSIGEGGLNRMALALGSERSSPGYIYAIDVDGAIMQAAKAAFAPTSRRDGSTLLIDTMTSSSSDLGLPDWRATPAHLLGPDRTREMLSNDSYPLQAFFTHGNGFDFDLRDAVFCGFETTDIPSSDLSGMLSCTHTGVCIRAGQTRLRPIHIKAEVLVLASCLGVLDAPAEVDLSVTAFATLAHRSEVRSIITTAHYWISKPESGLRLLEAVAGVRSLGELAAKLNKGLDPLSQTAFLLFGNPNFPAQGVGELSCHTIDPKGLKDGLVVQPGFHRFTFVQTKTGRCIIAIGGMNDQPKMRIARSAQESDALLILNSETVAIRATNSDQMPACAKQIRLGARTLLNFCDDLLPSMVDPDTANGYRIETLTLVKQAEFLEQATMEGRMGSLFAVTTEDYFALLSLDEQYSQLCIQFINHYLRWSVREKEARFVSSVWRPFFRQTHLTACRQCPNCGILMRISSYASVDTDVCRELAICSSCSAVSDLPRAQGLEITIHIDQEHEDRFELTVSFTHELRQDVQLGSAGFLMSRFEVLKESACQIKSKRLAPDSQWEMIATLKKPAEAMHGEYWIVFIGLIDGEVFTASRKILVDQKGIRATKGDQGQRNRP